MCRPVQITNIHLETLNKTAETSYSIAGHASVSTHKRVNKGTRDF
jgi:hypothetical protein